MSDMIIYENDEALAVLDIHPRAPGHTMILPKVHAENIIDLPAEKIKGVFTVVQKVAALLEKALKPDGFTIGINHGKVSGQTVDHLHIHIMPRWHGDGGGSVHDTVNNPPKQNLTDIKNQILQTINQKS